ncbi:MAG: ferritin-like domain-containing protein [Actinomycetota bacterium]|nr:ferritin-like domain-containing protein [Actinomycetota bacterium]
MQSDAMRGARSDLNSYVEAAQEARFESRRDLRIGAGALLGAGALGAAALAFASPASAANAQDIMALQTAAGLENLAVFTYKTALTLPFIGGSSANGVVKAFSMKTMQQHTEHGQAFNAAITKLGGKTQSATDPKYTPIVQAAAGKITGPLDVVSLAITLEDIAAETYVKDVGIVSTSDLRGLFASVAGVESQHKAILLAVQALLKGGAASLIALPPDATKLPAAAGSVGFPDSFFPTKNAAPVAEGAVQ